MGREELLERVINYQLSLRNLTRDDVEIVSDYDLDTLKLIYNVYEKEGLWQLFHIEITYEGKVDLTGYDQE